MANYREDIVDVELTGGNIHRSFMKKTIGEGDINANRFGVRVFRNGEPVQLAGSCVGYFIRAAGETVAISNGVISGNVAYVTLPQTCYAIEGVFSLAIKVSYGGETVTMRIIDGVVSRTSTDTAVDPGTIIPSVEALIQEIENVAASIPQDYSNLSRAFLMKGLTNDSVESSFVPIGTENKIATGTKTNGKAWRKNRGTPVDGSQYCYVTYETPSSYAGNVAVIYGHGWGEPYPLASFYNQNNELISVSGERANTAYMGTPVIIPTGTTSIVVNGRSDSDYNVGIAFFGLLDFVELIKNVNIAHELISQSYLSTHTSFADVKNWPNNVIYSISNDVYSQIADLPDGLNTYATIVKLNGLSSNTQAYTLYMCVNEYAVWIGFETTTALTWHLLKGDLKKKYLFIGDSYGDGYSHDGNNSGWCTYLANQLGLTSDRYEKRHQGGSGFANGGFLARLNSATGTGFTDVVVLGGFNDYNSSAENIESGINTFCQRVRTLFPAARILIGCVGWIKAGTGESAYSNWQDVRNAIIGKVLPAYQNCAKYGAEYAAFSEYLLTDDMMTPTDGYHPGETGNKAIAAGMANAVINGVACLPFKSVLKQ